MRNLQVGNFCPPETLSLKSSSFIRWSRWQWWGNQYQQAQQRYWTCFQTICPITFTIIIISIIEPSPHSSQTICLLFGRAVDVRPVQPVGHLAAHADDIDVLVNDIDVDTRPGWAARDAGARRQDQARQENERTPYRSCWWCSWSSWWKLKSKNKSNGMSWSLSLVRA